MLEKKLDNKIKPVNPKLTLEYSLEGLITEPEVPVLWPSYTKSQLLGKDPVCGERLMAEGDDRG